MWNVIDINCNEKAGNQQLNLIYIPTYTHKDKMKKERVGNDIAFQNGTNVSVQVLSLIKCK